MPNYDNKLAEWFKEIDETEQKFKAKKKPSSPEPLQATEAAARQAQEVADIDVQSAATEVPAAEMSRIDTSSVAIDASRVGPPSGNNGGSPHVDTEEPMPLDQAGLEPPKAGTQAPSLFDDEDAPVVEDFLSFLSRTAESDAPRVLPAEETAGEPADAAAESETAYHETQAIDEELVEEAEEPQGAILETAEIGVVEEEGSERAEAVAGIEDHVDAPELEAEQDAAEPEPEPERQTPYPPGQIVPPPVNERVVIERQPVQPEPTPTFQIPVIEDSLRHVEEGTGEPRPVAELLAKVVIQQPEAEREAPVLFEMEEDTVAEAPAREEAHASPAVVHAPAAAVEPDVQEKWDRMPHHLQTLFAASEEEVAQNSYKTFKESRADLIQRLLDPVITLEEAARILNVCPTTVRRYTNRGVLKHIRTAGNQRRFRLSDVLTFMESGVGRSRASQ